MVEPDPPKFGFRSLPTDKKLRSADVSNSFIDEVEHRLLARMMGQQTREESRRGHQPLLEHRSNGGIDLTADTSGDFLSELGDDTLNTTSPEGFVQREAVSLLDAPTLENVKLRLRQMQHEQREIRQRWSTLKFYDSKSKSKIFSASEIISDRPREPPAIEFGRHIQLNQRQGSNSPVNKEVVEVPLIFTKPAAGTRSIQYLHTVYPQGQDAEERGGRDSPLTLASLQQPARRLLSLRQTTAERIAADRARFESYLKRRSHHPSGKFDPWSLMDEISDEILMDCLKDISEEVEGINEDIANHMYKSEFLVDQSKSPTPELGYEAKQMAQHQQQRQLSSQHSPHRFSTGDDRTTVAHDRIVSREPSLRHGQAVGGAGGDQSSVDLPILGHKALQMDQQPITPRSPHGQLKTGSPLRGASPPGATSAHLWRSSPASPTGSVGQGVGSRSPTPRSPQHSASIGEWAGVRSPVVGRTGSGAGSPLRDGRSPPGGRQSPQVSASEPLLDDVSHLLPNKHSSDEEQSHRSQDTGVEDKERRDDHDSGDDDEDDEDYSEEDFEEVTDVEL
ncbi:protein moonraker [Plakobranchus ocellatus]|uniref:Protein moonraker n=1 Tax=Plakobranchus ocellatus TaxID=259542 RepID=A0AAV4BC83_9GAST|nr:protein moonraker [Plakobranchus ocellatus]